MISAKGVTVEGGITELVVSVIIDVVIVMFVGGVIDIEGVAAVGGNINVVVMIVVSVEGYIPHIVVGVGNVIIDVVIISVIIDVVVVVVMIVGVNVMGLYRAWIDVVIWVSIVKDQGATVVVTGKFDIIRVNRADRDNMRFAINLDDSFVRADGGGGEFSVGAFGNLAVTTDDVEFDAVGAVGVVIMNVINMAVVIGDAVEVTVVLDVVVVMIGIDGVGFHLVRIDVVGVHMVKVVVVRIDGVWVHMVRINVVGVHMVKVVVVGIVVVGIDGVGVHMVKIVVVGIDVVGVSMVRIVEMGIAVVGVHMMRVVEVGIAVVGVNMVSIIEVGIDVVGVHMVRIDVVVVSLTWAPVVIRLTRARAWAPVVVSLTRARAPVVVRLARAARAPVRLTRGPWVIAVTGVMSLIILGINSMQVVEMLSGNVAEVSAAAIAFRVTIIEVTGIFVLMNISDLTVVVMMIRD